MQHVRQQGFICPITGKQGYPTQQAAERARKWMKGHRKMRGAYQLETYGPCSCGQYHHTTSKPLGLVAAIT